VNDTVPQKLVVEPRDGYLYVVYGADTVTLQMIVDAINAVVEAIRANAYTRVLLARNGPLLESDAARALVAALIKNLVSEDVRFAIVDVYGNDPEQTQRALEASRATGWNVHGFESEADAIKWLMDSLVLLRPDRGRRSLLAMARISRWCENKPPGRDPAAIQSKLRMSTVE
jgi:hypothetical protein